MSRTVIAGILCTVLWPPVIARAQQARPEPRERTFQLEYAATLTDVPPGARVRVWIPLPPSTPDQKVEIKSIQAPGTVRRTTEPKYGNRMLYFETRGPASGQLEFSSVFQVRRQEVLGLSDREVSELTDAQRRIFLTANTKVPLVGPQLGLLESIALPREPIALARTLYDRVDDHVRYDKSQPGYGQGDVLWVCDSRFGNCTDFHSLFIALCRAQGLPARFEIGFSLPPERGAGEIGGYHCWAWFHAAEKGWIPVDISEADKHPDMKQYYFGNLTENRVAFTVGRDITLVPRQDGDPLNYFIYPHIEVDGHVWTEAKAAYRYRDQ